MVKQPKRAIAFIDGQNLYHHAKEAFGHKHPNFDPMKLSDAICKEKGWVNQGVRFYTGVPDARRDPRWHGYWTNRLLAMCRQGIIVESRTLKYHPHSFRQTDGSVVKKLIAQEKGIDLRLALDVVRLVREGQLDVAVIFSQDLNEMVKEVKSIARERTEVVSAFPDGPNATFRRGLDGAEW